MTTPSKRRKPSWLNKQVFGWAMFDFANQAFTLVILTAMFQVYFIEYIVGDNGPPENNETIAALVEHGNDAETNAGMEVSRGMYLWSLAGVITQIIIIIVAPILGAVADFSGAKKKLLFITWLGCVIFTASLSLIPPGAVVMGMTLFIIAYLFYAGGENFMAAFLPELAEHRFMGRVSAFGWTLGYCGGLLCLAGAAGLLLIWEGATGYRLISLWAAVFFFAGALPTFILLKEKKQAEDMPEGYNYFTIGFRRLYETYQSLRNYRWLFRFIAIMAFYFAGVQVVFWFAGTMTRQLFGFGEEKMGLFLLQITITAIFGALLTGRYQDRIGARNFLLIVLAWWAVTVLGAAIARQEWMFWVVGNAVGLGLGAIGTSSRAMVGLFSPQFKAAEFFGFFGFAHKFSAILGLTSISVAMMIFQDLHIVVAVGSVYFVLGFLLMLTVNEREGRTAALRAQRAFERAQK